MRGRETDIQWNPKLPQNKLRRLYDADALGLPDDALVDDVGMTLYLRCQSIIIATEARAGRARCPQCDALIVHSSRKDEILRCAGCAWELSRKHGEHGSVSLNNPRCHKTR